jgi:hypothetical protein
MEWKTDPQNVPSSFSSTVGIVLGTGRTCHIGNLTHAAKQESVVRVDAILDNGPSTGELLQMAEENISFPLSLRGMSGRHQPPFPSSIQQIWEQESLF